MKRTTAVRVICIILALIFVLSLLTVIIPTRANAVTQSEINALQAKRDQIRAQQAELRSLVDTYWLTLRPRGSQQRSGFSMGNSADALADACYPGNPREATKEQVIEMFRQLM